VLTSVAGRPTATPADVATALRGADDGAVDIVLIRDRREVTVKATLPDREGARGRRTVPI
jgi:S1-C subfamily serine protease